MNTKKVESEVEGIQLLHENCLEHPGSYHCVISGRLGNTKRHMSLLRNKSGVKRYSVTGGFLEYDNSSSLICCPITSVMSMSGMNFGSILLVDRAPLRVQELMMVRLRNEPELLYHVQPLADRDPDTIKATQRLLRERIRINREKSTDDSREKIRELELVNSILEGWLM